MVRDLTEKERFSREWALRNQIRSASGSVMDCIAEGFERGNNNEFRYFLGVAKGSCGEVRSQSYRALDYGFVTQDEFERLQQVVTQTSMALQGLVAYLGKTNLRGTRYREKTDHLRPYGDFSFPDREV